MHVYTRAHSKNVFVTLTYSLTFETRASRQQMFSYLLYTEFLHTPMAIIIIGVAFYHAIYYSGNQVSCFVDKYRLICLHAVSSANLMVSLWLLWLLQNITVYYYYYGIYVTMALHCRVQINSEFCCCDASQMTKSMSQLQITFCSGACCIYACRREL